MIAGVLFDMDGLLIDSEPLWQRAEIEVFATVGIALTPALCLETRGRRVDEVVEHWFRIAPWSGTPAGEIRDRIVARVADLVRSEGKAKPGVEHAIGFFERRGLPLGVASSSDYAIIEATLAKLGARPRFTVIHSGEDEPVGKPHPGVYLNAARKLSVAAPRCLALEDSPSGVAAAKAAGMRCIGVVDGTTLGVEGARAERARLGAADVVLDSLAEIDEEIWTRLDREP